MTTPTEDESRKSNFFLEEYKSLRSEILLLKQQHFRIHMWTIVTLGIIYGLAFGVTGEGATVRPSVLPRINQELLFIAAFFVVAFGAFMVWVHDYMIYRIADYIRDIENYIAGSKPEPIGWEHFQGRGPDVKYPHPVTGILRSPNWLAVIVISVSLMLVGAFIKI